ncbi:hypothetical protein MSG28_005428 [Choristoneura fumiferana]|uniref:Uncharacterized protein n=1 Tax=Choristoneura fumiferana TaxID=7141 RepID=A0ACC0JRG2_CHOFU|nr:hypothetical protein MSG28_005428 [Choristoneura fumiferana]
MVCVKFPIRTGPAWELLPKPSHSEGRPVPCSGTCKAPASVACSAGGRHRSGAGAASGVLDCSEAATTRHAPHATRHTPHATARDSMRTARAPRYCEYASGSAGGRRAARPCARDAQSASSVPTGFTQFLSTITGSVSTGRGTGRRQLIAACWSRRALPLAACTWPDLAPWQPPRPRPAPRAPRRPRSQTPRRARRGQPPAVCDRAPLAQFSPLCTLATRGRARSDPTRVAPVDTAAQYAIEGSSRQLGDLPQGLIPRRLHRITFWTDSLARTLY